MSSKLSSGHHKKSVGGGRGRREEDAHDHTHYHGVDKAEKHISVRDALSKFLKEITPLTKSEVVKASDSLNRVLSQDVISGLDVPSKARSTRDGYALNVTDEVVAGSRFKITGEVRIGRATSLSVGRGEAVQVATGSFLPKGANTVVMKEYVEEEENQPTLIVNRNVRAGENILQVGADVRKGSLALPKGTVIRAHNVALLAMIGARHVRVFQRPRIAFFSTGDELVDVFSRAASSSSINTSKGENKRNNHRKEENNDHKNDKIRTSDVTRPFIHSMILELGAVPVDLGIARDNFSQIRQKLVRGLSYDGLILSAGSSVGERDYVAKAVASLKGVRMIVHGIAMRPSSPTGLGAYRGRPLIMLPGFPTSAMVSFFVFARPAILKLAGELSPSALPTPLFATANMPILRKVKLEDDYDGKAGLTHFPRVAVKERNNEYFAHVVKPTEAQYSSWLKESNGIGTVGPEKTSLKAGETLDVLLIGNIA